MNNMISENASVAAETELDNMVVLNVQEKSLPQVCLPGNGVTITETAEELARIYSRESDPFKRLYNHGGYVCYVMKSSKEGFLLAPLSPKRACSTFERVATLGRKKKSKGTSSTEEVFEPDVCSTDNASKILESDPFRDNILKINLVTNAPVILEMENHECKIINTYDKQSGIFPTGTPAEEVSLSDALRLLNQSIADFHFKTESDKSRALAALLSPALISGGILKVRVPVAMLEADQSQAGKGFFTKILGAIYHEVPATVTQRERGTGGLDENFDAAVCKGRQMIVMDNLRGKLNSPQIESFLSMDTHTARVPYAAQVEIDPRRYIIMATSNNYELTTDMANRSNIIRILKRPFEYRFQTFPEGNILAHIVANQPKYLGAVFTIIREWVRQGKPVMPAINHDFRDWCEALDWIVQNILHCAPLMEGHEEIKKAMVFPECQWFCDMNNIIQAAGKGNTPLTAYEIAVQCEAGGMEVPAAYGTRLIELEDKNRQQVCSQIGRRFSNLFKKFGDENSVCMGSFSLFKEQIRRVYPSGKSEEATMYRFFKPA